MQYEFVISRSCAVQLNYNCNDWRFCVDFCVLNVWNGDAYWPWTNRRCVCLLVLLRVSICLCCSIQYEVVMKKYLTSICCPNTLHTLAVMTNPRWFSLNVWNVDDWLWTNSSCVFISLCVFEFESDIGVNACSSYYKVVISSSSVVQIQCMQRQRWLCVYLCWMYGTLSCLAEKTESAFVLLFVCLYLKVILVSM